MYRIDLCHKHQQYDTIDILGHLVQNVTACNLKVLIIADTADWAV